MSSKKPSYGELKARLTEAEAIIAALRCGEVDAVVSERNVAVLRLKEVEEELKSSLREKDVLMQEIHHRVKNNLQIISSLLKLQKQHVENEEVRRTLDECGTRVIAMAIIHEKLYASENLAEIDMSEYVPSLAGKLVETYGIAEGSIALNTEVESIPLEIKWAIPCALILNELVSNSLKHAFPDDRGGEINICLKREERQTKTESAATETEHLQLVVRDNGVGLPDRVEFDRRGSLGLSLVRILAEDQLRGEVKVGRTGGTDFSIEFDVERAV